jgi:L-fuculose-phosphate aldolase
MDERQAKIEVIEAGKILVDRGLVARTWGNISCRIDENRFAITPSGIGYERLTLDNIVTVNILTLEYRGGVKPSSEKGIHASAYRMDSGINFIIHTHQNFATALSLAGLSALDPTEQEINLLGGRPQCAKYGISSTKKLRRHVQQALGRGGPVLMERHGALLVGADRDTAFQRAVVLEAICRRAVGNLSGSVPVPGPHSRRLDGGGFEFSGGNGTRSFPGFGDEDAMSPIERLHAAVYTGYPQFNHIMQMSSLAVETVMGSLKTMPTLLDDFAQMVGPDVKICGPLSTHNLRQAIQRVSRALGGQNCVCVQGAGALCCAADEADCAALLSLVEKNALACANALAYGVPKPLSYIDRKLQRLVYTLTYSKKK